jgi:hypothetical protein
VPRIRADGDDVTTTIPPVTCAAPGCKRRAARYVEVEHKGASAYFLICAACLTDMRNDPQGTTITVRAMPPVSTEPAPEGEPPPPQRRHRATRPPPPPPPPPRDLSSWDRMTVANEYGLSKTALILLKSWQSSPRTVHTTESAAEMTGCGASHTRTALRELAGIGLAQRKPHPRTKCVILYHLTVKGERA